MWFRNDLRIHDNLALIDAMASGSCKAIFITTPNQWEKHDVGRVKIAFIQAHLNELAESLAALGVCLDVIEGHDFDSQISILTAYCRQHHISQVFANSEPEFNEVRRDQQLTNSELNLALYESDVIVAKGSVRTLNDAMFKVFTPFKKAWLRLASVQQHVAYGMPASISIPMQASTYQLTDDETAIRIVNKWPLASLIRGHLLSEFFENKHDDYHLTRDFPALKGTSGLSAYLAVGAISVREVLQHLLHHHPLIFDDMTNPKFSWLNELVWRDFYRHIQYHFPRLAKGECFQARYEKLPWLNTPKHFKAWREGQTGYPIVDAAMRQLNTTGWMHNRLRMVVASFLTKHLLIDWRWGERYFMQHLIDGDFSANNGGWQWAASTGCDAQPYFRIFNPLRQSERFDPNGDFIRMYLPELENVPLKSLHFPHKYLSEHQMKDIYCEPLVEHKVARLQALAFYKDGMSKNAV